MSAREMIPTTVFMDKNRLNLFAGLHEDEHEEEEGEGEEDVE
jgi:hypothetical protein